MDSSLETKRSGVREVFVSYHFTTLDLTNNGFGNFVGQFNAEVYGDSMAKFIQDIEKSIEMSLENQLAIKCKVKVLFFR